jgi:uncharacterized damage-inducible protein DinB
MTASTAQVETLLGQFDRVLEERTEEYGRLHWHSLIRNLETVRPQDWDTRAPGGGRTIRDIVLHIGQVFLAYARYGFGDGTWVWTDTTPGGITPGTTPDDLVRWLRATHAEFRNGIATLTDDNLDTIGIAFDDGPPWTNRRIVEVMIQHPLYHIGEINYLRALLQANDDWMHQDNGREDAMS